METKKDDLRKIFKIVLFAIVTYWVFNNFSVIGSFISNIFEMLSPFIIGGALAFIINIPMAAIEKKLVKPRKSKKKNMFQNKKIARGASLILAIIIILVIMFLIIKLIVPELINIVKLLIDNIPYYVGEINKFLQTSTESGDNLKEFVSGIDIKPENIKDEVMSVISNVLSSSISFVGSLIGFIANTIISVVFAIYILVSKEKLQDQFKRVFKAYLSEKTYNWINSVLRITRDTFSNFFTVQVLESTILGGLCILGMLLLKIPYAIPVGVLVGVTALIPIVGAFIGIIIGAILIVSVAPIKVITFVVFVVILLQVETNLIYPKVVGDSVGLPGIWVLVAVSLGGSLFGIIGMLVGVPTASVLYTLIRNDVNKRLKS